MTNIKYCTKHSSYTSSSETECEYAFYRPDAADGECEFINISVDFQTAVAQVMNGSTEVIKAIEQAMTDQNFEALCNLTTTVLHGYNKINKLLEEYK